VHTARVLALRLDLGDSRLLGGDRRVLARPREQRQADAELERDHVRVLRTTLRVIELDRPVRALFSARQCDLGIRHLFHRVIGEQFPVVRHVGYQRIRIDAKIGPVRGIAERTFGRLGQPARKVRTRIGDFPLNLADPIGEHRLGGFGGKPVRGRDRGRNSAPPRAAATSASARGCSVLSSSRRRSPLTA
jgi:hypothetical protein